MTETSEQGYVGDSDEDADRLFVECQDCGMTDPYPNTEGGFENADDFAAAHVDDGHPCENTRVMAIFPDGSEKRVA